MSLDEQSVFLVMAQEIIKMSERDQFMRKSRRWDATVDVENTERMKSIVAEIGWPTCSKVGRYAANMAWLLVQHADHDHAFQEHCLTLMKSYPSNEVEPANIAYLEDRVRVGKGLPQLYGTQFFVDDQGEFGPRPIEDPGHVDERRKSVGLGSLATYIQQIVQMYNTSTPDT